MTAADGKSYMTNLYELEAIISLGMRVSSKKGTHFKFGRAKSSRNSSSKASS